MRSSFKSKRFVPLRPTLTAVCCSWLTLTCHLALAQDAALAVSSFTFGKGACPDPIAVEREVRRLIPSERQAELARGVRIDVADLGESYRVVVSKESVKLSKNYADRGRDCDGRARFAAVFAVLAIMPPELEGSDVTPAPVAPPPVSAPPRQLVPPAPRVEPSPLPALARLELSGFLLDAPPLAQSPQISTWGVELGVALGRGELTSFLSVGYGAPARFDRAGGRGVLTPVPASLGARLNSQVGPLRIAGEFGGLALFERVRGIDLLSTKRTTTLDLGVRAGLRIAWSRGSRFSPFVGVVSWIVPVPRELSLLPQGVIGRLPYFWLGATVGVSLGL